MTEHKLAIISFLAILIAAASFLYSCGINNPGAVSQIQNVIAGSGAISGSVYSITTQSSGLIQGKLAGATVVANNVTTITDNAGNYSLSGLPATVTLSAAKSGYICQTIEGIPTTLGQDIHLALLNPPAGVTTSNTIPITTGSIHGTILNASGAPVAGANVELRDANATVWAMGSTLANGSYTASLNNLNVANPLTIIVSQQTASGTNYYTAEIAYATNIVAVNNSNITQNLTTTAANPASIMTVSLSNVPATTPAVPSIHNIITISLVLPNNAGYFPIAGTTGGWPAAGNTITSISYPISILPGITYRLDGSAADNTFYANPVGEPVIGAFANLEVTAPGNYTISFLSIPQFTGITTDPSGNIIMSATPTLTWSAVPGTAQYHLDIEQSFINPNTNTENFNYYWEGYTTNTTIAKTNFNPANGGNLITGQTYEVNLHVMTPVQTGANSIFPLNPLIQNPSVVSHGRLVQDQNNMPGNSKFSVQKYTGTVQ